MESTIKDAFANVKMSNTCEEKIIKSFQARPSKQYTVQVPEPSEETPTTGENCFITVPKWPEERDDGLYFLANGEEIEIGSLITEEIPFTYVYTDRDTTYYFVVGGNYVADGFPLEGVGWALWQQNAILAETNPAAAWRNGYSAGIYNPTTGQNHAWYTAGKNILGVPFP